MQNNNTETVSENLSRVHKPSLRKKTRTKFGAISKQNTMDYKNNVRPKGRVKGPTTRLEKTRGFPSANKPNWYARIKPTKIEANRN